MKSSIYFCLLFMTVVLYGEAEEKRTGNNKLLGGPFNCVNERPGTTCPSAEDMNSCKTIDGKSKKGPKTCFSSSDPLTYFYLFTPNNTQKAEMLHKCGGMLPKNSNFNPKLKTVVVIHGLCDGFCKTADIREIKDQLYCNGDYNVLAVDWTRDSFPDFYDAINAVPDVAKRICCVLKNIRRQAGLSRKKLHIVGLSAGAHIAGFVGKCWKGIRRITGLDPTNAGFLDKDCSGRLCREDACLVDVIHTSSGECLLPTLSIGYPYPMGHLDFYPNGGSVQPSCLTELPFYFASLDIISGLYALVPSFCYHLQAVKYFLVSINPCGCEFVGVECTHEDFEAGKCNKCEDDGSNCAVMGFNAENYKTRFSRNATRNFFLNTGLKCPYCDNSDVKLNGFPKNCIKKDPGLKCFDPNSYCYLREGQDKDD